VLDGFAEKMVVVTTWASRRLGEGLISSISRNGVTTASKSQQESFQRRRYKNEATSCPAVIILSI
jgi:hypothetical protein